MIYISDGCHLQRSLFNKPARKQAEPNGEDEDGKKIPREGGDRNGFDSGHWLRHR